MTNDVRHRLIPTRGNVPSWFVLGRDAALAEAEAAFKTTEIEVLVCSFPRGGVIRPVALIGTTTTKAKRR